MRDTLGVKINRVAALAVLGIFTAFPLYTMIITSFKPLGDVQNVWRWLPTRLTLAPYADIWQTIPLARYLLNSLVVSLLSAFFSVIVAVLAAYAISRYRFRGRELFRFFVLSTSIFPGILFLLPLYLLYVNVDRITGLHLYGSRYGLILTYLTFTLAVSIWMLVGFFSTLPRELEEAALVDGTTPLGALIRIVIPLSLPGS